MRYRVGIAAMPNDKPISLAFFAKRTEGER